MSVYTSDFPKLSVPDGTNYSRLDQTIPDHIYYINESDCNQFYSSPLLVHSIALKAKGANYGKDVDIMMTKYILCVSGDGGVYCIQFNGACGTVQL